MIDRFLTDITAARGNALIVRGEIGIGKSVLLDYAAERATGFRTLRAACTPSEAELPFAGLHLLLHPSMDRIGALPPAQADALRSALGMGDSAVSDQFMVALAVLTILTDLTESGPVLCLIDDAHWMDRASIDALLFAARRVGAAPIGLVFATRDDPRVLRAPGLPELRPAVLDRSASAEVLADGAANLAPHVRDRIIEEAGGNPLALVGLLATLTPEERAGRPRSPAFGTGTLSASSRLRRAFGDQVDALPEGTRTLLLVTAADDTNDLSVVLRVARRLGASLADLEPAENRRLVMFGDGRLRFRHALIRAAAYDGAPADRRRTVHRALADALDGAGDADRRAWHLAAATITPDEEVASALERGAEQARRRGGLAAVAAAYERAAQLSPDRDRCGRRLVLAAQAATDAGRPDWAGMLADQAAPDVSDRLLTAELARVQAIAAAERGEPRAAHDLLIEAAVTFADVAAPDTALVIFDAMAAACTAGDKVLARSTVARLSELNPPTTPAARLLMRGAFGLVRMLEGEPEEGIPALRDMVEGARRQGRGLELRVRAAIGVWDFLTGDFESSFGAAVALERDCRDQGALGVVPRTLLSLARSQLSLGLHRDAVASAAEGLRIARETSQTQDASLLSAFLAHIAAIEGDGDRCLAVLDGLTVPSGSTDRPIGLAEAWGVCALGLLDLGAGRHEKALHRLRHVFEAPAQHVIAPAGLADLVEAAVRLGTPETVVEPVRRFHRLTAQLGRPWAQALNRRCRALLASGDEAEGYYLEAIRLHGRGAQPFERGRTELLYGEWLRRDRRRSDAQHPLRSALEVFERLGATPWAERARAELRTSGQSQAAGSRDDDPLSRLTPHELEVVRLAANGLSNRDIATRLSLSPRTVGYHLYRAYPKLGVASRHELTHVIRQRTVTTDDHGR